ncbi:MAG TPA: AAA family ATPase [Polyangiaceae bacterium]|nr:AAA family ATPase [Polyangiaceae bacterium]
MTGGPGGGKTTAADLFRRELGEQVVIVPESATILFGGGFPRAPQLDAVRSTQTAIFHVQRSLEDVQAALYPGRVLLCDRGTIDGAAYWPDGSDEYFLAMSTSLEAELARYDAVVFFETAAVAGLSIEGGNPVRRESLEQARHLDAQLKLLWSRHRRFLFVPHDPSFFRKLTVALALLQEVTEELRA